jgi:hypothetical protein
MLVACRLAGLSALGAHYAGVNRRAQCEAACQLGRLVRMAAKIRRLARNSKLGDDAAITWLGNSYRRVRVGL